MKRILLVVMCAIYIAIVVFGLRNAFTKPQIKIRQNLNKECEQIAERISAKKTIEDIEDGTEWSDKPIELTSEEFYKLSEGDKGGTSIGVCRNGIWLSWSGFIKRGNKWVRAHYGR